MSFLGNFLRGEGNLVNLTNGVRPENVGALLFGKGEEVGDAAALHGILPLGKVL